MATGTPTIDAVAWQQETMIRESRDSLANFMGHVVIDARPQPQQWGLCVEPWQVDIVAPLIPALEQMAGVRSDYEGPRSFFYVLPRGHDKTGLMGRIGNWSVGFSRLPISAIAAASTREQAALLLYSMKAELRLNPWLDGIIEPQNYVMHGKGGLLKVISADAPHSSGLKADLIVLDELTFWDKRDLFDILYSGREKRPGSVFIIITNAGLRGSWQHDLLLKAKDDPKNWHVYETPEGQQLARWMDADRVASMRAMLPRGHAKRVLDNVWIDSTETPLLTTEMIDGCECDPDDNCLWPNGVMPEGRLRDIYMGWDIGRSQDRSVVWTDELIGDVMTTREILVMDNVSFDDQEAAVISRMDARRRHVRRLHIDKGGIGMQMAERMEKRFPGVAEGFQLNASRQGAFALALQTAFKLHKVRIPRDPTLRADLQLIDQVETGGTGVPVLKTNKGVTGHGDRFWAKALAQSGLPVPGRKDPYRPIGKSRPRFAV